MHKCICLCDGNRVVSESRIRDCYYGIRKVRTSQGRKQVWFALRLAVRRVSVECKNQIFDPEDQKSSAAVLLQGAGHVSGEELTKSLSERKNQTFDLPCCCRGGGD